MWVHDEIQPVHCAEPDAIGAVKVEGALLPGSPRFCGDRAIQVLRGEGGHSNEHRSSELRFIWNRQLNKICLFGNVEKKGIDPIMASLYNCPETSSDQLIYHHPKIFIKGRAQAYMLHNGEFSSFLKFSFWSIDTPSVDNQIKIKCLPSVDDICPKNIYVP